MKRVPQLDGVRGCAIILVLVWHYFGTSTPLDSESGSWSHILHRALGLTWSGVDLFFVLSGFLIAGILLDHRNSENYFSVFYIRRACRILPLYFLLLLSFVVLSNTNLATNDRFLWLFDDPMPVWSYFTFTQNVLMGFGSFGAGWLGVTWSLAIEEQFYLLLPLLVHRLSRRCLCLVLLCLVLLAPLLRSLSPGFHNYVNALPRADSILLGAILAVLVRWPAFLSVVRQHRATLWAGFWLFLFGAMILTWRRSSFGVFNHTWLAAFYGIFVLLAFFERNSFLSRCLASKPLVWAGTVSYGLYLAHMPVLVLLRGMIPNNSLLGTSNILLHVAISLLAITVTCAVAEFSYRYFESPFLRLGHRCKYRMSSYQVFPNSRVSKVVAQPSSQNPDISCK